MTEMKLPKVGEWWRTREGEIVKVIADLREHCPHLQGRDEKEPLLVVDEHGTRLSYTGGGYFYLTCDNSEYDLVEHLPDCTGFDWVPEPPQKPIEDRVSEIERRLSALESSNLQHQVWNFNPVRR